MRYKAALLDLDDVLFPTSDYTEKVLHASVDAMINEGLPAEQDQALEALRAIRRKRGSNAGNHFNYLCQVYGFDPVPQRIVQAGVSAYHSLREELCVPQEETNAFLAFLNSKDFRMSIITSGLEHKQWFKIVRLGIQGYVVETDREGNVVKEFVYVLPEDTVDKIKGKQELSARALRDKQADPAKTFILDDRPYGIIAAKKQGVRYGIRLRRGKYIAEECPTNLDNSLRPDFEVENLEQAIEVISELERIIAAKTLTS